MVYGYKRRMLSVVTDQIKMAYKVLYRKCDKAVKTGHRQRDVSGKQFVACISDVIGNPVVQQMKSYNHHSRTNCFNHSMHVAYYNYIICKRFNLDYRTAAKAGMLHDLFLYDWHGHGHDKGELPHGFTHPSRALKNAHDNFKLTKKDGDMITKHMFPLTLSIPKYKETCVIIMTDKFCSTCEVMDGMFRKKIERR